MSYLTGIAANIQVASYINKLYLVSTNVEANDILFKLHSSKPVLWASITANFSLFDPNLI